MKRVAFLLVLLLLIPQISSSGIKINMVKAYEYSKWEYFKVGIKNQEGPQKLTVRVRAYDVYGYQSYRISGNDVILTKEDGSSYLARPAFSQTASEWWGAGAYREVLLRWVLSPCNCKRFKEYPVVVIVEVFRNGSLMPADSTIFYMESEYISWNPD